MSGACQHDWHFVQGLTARLRCTRCGQMTWPKDAEQKVQEVLRDVHSCSYYCDRPECIKAQRDELRDRLMRPEQEPLQFKCTVIDDAHPNGVPLEQWGKQPEQEPVTLPCCGYADASAVKWNPYSKAVQCHNCGQTYTPLAQPEQEHWDAIPDAFNKWWDADYDDTGNPFRKNSPAYWAWAGWKAASKQPEQQPVKESSVTHSHLWIGDLYGKEKNT